MLDQVRGEAALSSSVIALRGQRDVLQIVGPDAASYLHGQMSQDVEGLAIGDSAASLLLQPQGKIDAWVRLSRVADQTFWLDTEIGFGAAAVERLQRFKLRVDAEITLMTLPMVAIRGPDCPALADLARPAGGAILAPLGRYESAEGVDGWDLLGPDVDVPEGIEEGPGELLELDRISRGIPAMGSELDTSTIPAAAGIVSASVDFEKGCYVGQELVARVDSRGNNTPTRLCSLSVAGTTASLAGGDLVVDGTVIGTITSATPTSEGTSRGLGYIKRAATVPTSATVTTAGETLTVEVSDL